MTRTARSQSHLRKIVFVLDPEAWHGYETETVWAEGVAANRYRLRNTPFFAKGVSVEDVVRIRSQGGALFFDGVSISSGHSTYRIIVNDATEPSVLEDYWSPLQTLGCTYESAEMNTLLLAVDVPPGVDVYAAYTLLEKGEADGIWYFEEGHCGHLEVCVREDAT